MCELLTVWQVKPYLREIEGCVHPPQDNPVLPWLEDDPVLTHVTFYCWVFRCFIVTPLVPSFSVMVDVLSEIDPAPALLILEHYDLSCPQALQSAGGPPLALGCSK